MRYLPNGHKKDRPGHANVVLKLDEKPAHFDTLRVRWTVTCPETGEPPSTASHELDRPRPVAKLNRLTQPADEVTSVTLEVNVLVAEVHLANGKLLWATDTVTSEVHTACLYFPVATKLVFRESIRVVRCRDMHVAAGG